MVVQLSVQKPGIVIAWFGSMILTLLFHIQGIGTILIMWLCYTVLQQTAGYSLSLISCEQ